MRFRLPANGVHGSISANSNLTLHTRAAAR